MGLFGKKYLIEHPERFEKQEREVIALAESTPYGGRFNGAGDRLWKASVRLIACIDCESGELMELPRYLVWNYKEGGNNNIHGIRKQCIYRLKVLFSLPDGENYPLGRSMFVTKVIKKNVSDKRLSEILEEYRKPVSIDTAWGKLELDRESEVFEGTVKWRDGDTDVSLSVDSGSDTCETAMKTFEAVMADQTVWERKAKLYIAAEYTENANDWQSDEEDYKPITIADFAKRITLCAINFYDDGTFEFWFDDDGMFFGHSLLAEGSVEEGFTDSNMAG